MVAYHDARVRYDARVENSGSPSEEVAAWVHVFPAPPIKSWFGVMLPTPVPPRVAERVPTQLGEKVWVLPEETMVRFTLVSDEVAKV